MTSSSNAVYANLEVESRGEGKNTFGLIETGINLETKIKKSWSLQIGYNYYTGLRVVNRAFNNFQLFIENEDGDVNDISLGPNDLVSLNGSFKGETALRLDELVIIAQHFNVSLDDLLEIEQSANSVDFHYQRLLDNLDYLEYLNFISNEFNIQGFNDQKQMIYSAKDFPAFYYFLFPEILAFKAFFFARVLWGVPGFKEMKFALEPILNMMKIDNKMLNVGKHILENYTSLPSIEIWNSDTANGHLSQIKYSWETGLFEDKESALFVCRKTQELFGHIKEQAAQGQKFIPGSINYRADYSLYLIDAVQLEHTILLNMGDRQKTYLVYNTGDYLLTTNEEFCMRTERYMENLIKKSSLISQVHEKGRNQLFNHIDLKLKKLIKMIEES